MIDKIIAGYLAEGRRLIVPGFGAFIHKDGDGVVVFVPFLKKDDGVLVGLLNREYGLSEEEAHGVIAEYIAQVEKSIDDRGAFTVEGVGQLKPDANGILYLTLGSGAAAGAKAPEAAAASAAAPVAPAGGQAEGPVEPATAPKPVAVPPPTPSPARPAQPAAHQPPAEPVAPASRPAAPAAQSPQQAPPRPAASLYGQPNRPPQGPPKQRPPQGARRPAPPRPAPAQTKTGKADRFMLIAIIAAVIALAAIIYSLVSSPVGPRIEPIIEAPAPVVLDSLQTETPPTPAETE